MGFPNRVFSCRCKSTLSLSCSISGLFILLKSLEKKSEPTHISCSLTGGEISAGEMHSAGEEAFSVCVPKTQG